MTVLASNIEGATLAELQKYMEEHGVVEIVMRRERSLDNVTGWIIVATLVNNTQIAGGPFPEMKDAMKFLIHKLEEA